VVGGGQGIQVAGMGGKQTIVINKPGGGQMTAAGKQVGVI
jgi:hypothetical protein